MNKSIFPHDELPKFILGVEGENCPFVIHTREPAFIGRVSEDGTSITPYPVDNSGPILMPSALLSEALDFWRAEMES